jgi:ABC-type Co2+ transport system permease subunit
MHRSKVKFAACAVACGEIAVSLAPWSPPKVALVLLAGAAFFHLIAATAMGLNTFLFAFPALFPAAMYVSRTLYRQ